MSAASESSFLLIALILGLLSFSFNEPSDCTKWEILQFFLLVTFMAFWAYVTFGLNKPTSQEEAYKTQKLNEAIPLAGDSGVSQQWYNSCGQLLEKIIVFVITWLICAIVHLIVIAYPYSIWEWLGTTIQSAWNYVVTNYSHKTIFIFGVWGAEFATYWIIGLLYAILDLKRPTLIQPFKVQENFVLTKEDFFICCKVGMRNQIICLIIIYFLWDIYPLLSPQGFDQKLPSLIEIIISIVVFLPFTEIWFYCTHIMLHKSDWLWSHIHYVHHEWTAPIALNCIYAHWCEFIGVNVMMLLLGPFVMGSHVVIWIIWACAGMLSTLHGHSGWHLPFLPAPEGHDYHHLTGEQNYGTLGIFDTFFGTNLVYLTQAWQAEVDHKYSDQMYPVDKILAMNGDNPNDNGNEQKSNTKPIHMLEVGKKSMPSNANCFGKSIYKTTLKCDHSEKITATAATTITARKNKNKKEDDDDEEEEEEEEDNDNDDNDDNDDDEEGEDGDEEEEKKEEEEEEEEEEEDDDDDDNMDLIDLSSDFELN